MIKINDRVRLKRDKAADFTSRSGGVDWVSRRGTVVRISGSRTSIFVQWDGRTSADQWPAQAIEKDS